MQTPEQLARTQIDALLSAAGWVLQDRDHLDHNAALGVAVREFPLPAGVIEAERTGVVACRDMEALFGL